MTRGVNKILRHPGCDVCVSHLQNQFYSEGIISSASQKNQQAV